MLQDAQSPLGKCSVFRERVLIGEKIRFERRETFLGMMEYEGVETEAWFSISQGMGLGFNARRQSADN